MNVVQLNRLKARIVELADHPNGNVRRAVALSLREFKISENTVSILNRYLVDKQPMVRLEAAKTIRYNYGDSESAVSFLAKRLGCDYNSLRPTVLSILSGSVSTEKEGDVKKRELIAEVKREIAVSAAWIDHDLLINPLIQYLGSDNPQARIAGAVGLGNIGHPKACAPLEELALKSEEDTKVRKPAIVSLGKIKEPSSAESLARLTEDKSDEVRREAVIALNHIKPEGAEEVFLKTISDESPAVREVSCIALGNLKNRDHMEKIVACLKDTQPTVRKAAASVLGSWREIDSLPFILDRIDDGNEFVQNEVALAYLRMPRSTGRNDLEVFFLKGGADGNEDD